MPVASSSRRKAKARLQDSSDIEEEKPTQISTQDDVDDDEVKQSQRPGKSVKKEKKLTTKRREERQERDEQDEEEDDDEDDYGRIDVENFRNQPLGKADLTKLKGLASDWVHMGQKIKQNSGIIGDVAVSMADVAEGEEREKGLTELDIIMKDLVDVGEEMRAHEKAVEEIHQMIAQGEPIDDAVERYQSGVQQKMKDYGKKTTRQKYAKSEQYIAFKQGIYEVDHPGGAMPPITELITKEAGDDSDDDDDLEIGGVTQDYKCPLTLTPLKDPWTSQVCGHSFSADAIREFFNRVSGTEKCPASGCNKSFRLSDCKPDKELAKKVKAVARRVQRQQEDSDAEEVIE